jgi:ankyrin repeat protein
MTAEEAARSGDGEALAALPEDLLHARSEPYGWTLLHTAAAAGHANVVELLLARGLDVNARDAGDNSYAMHWAAAAGHLEIVRMLADAGGDVVGRGDDHQLEVIGWATCWEEPHADVAEFLVSRGARHTIFSAIALNLAAEVRKLPVDIRMSRNEDHQLPLHFAVRKQRREMVALLLELGADPHGADASGYTATAYATAPGIDRPIAEATGPTTLVAALVLRDWEAAEQLTDDGALHLMAKRDDREAVTWLLDRGADPNALWAHWDANVTPLHLAALHGHAETVELLLQRGADRHVHDSKHDSDPAGWAEAGHQPAVAELLRA